MSSVEIILIAYCAVVVGWTWASYKRAERRRKYFNDILQRQAWEQHRAQMRAYDRSLESRNG